MSKTIKKEEMVNNSNQPQQTENNINHLLKKIDTFEICPEDVEGISEEDEFSDSEIQEFESEHSENLYDIYELETIIEKGCDSDEDKEEILSKIDELKDLNDELVQKLIRNN